MILKLLLVFKKTLLPFIFLFIIGCSAEDSSSNKSSWSLSEGMEYPKGNQLSRAEDGVMLDDGTLIVADQRHGLAKIEVDGTVEPFGKFDGAFKEDYEFVAGSGDLDECNGKFVNGQYKYFATESEIQFMQQSYDDGISWGEAKEILFNSVNQELQPIRSKYEELSKNKDHINDLLSDGAKKARLIAKEKILEIREAVGLSKIL